MLKVCSFIIDLFLGLVLVLGYVAIASGFSYGLIRLGQHLKTDPARARRAGLWIVGVVFFLLMCYPISEVGRELRVWLFEN